MSGNNGFTVMAKIALVIGGICVVIACTPMGSSNIGRVEVGPSSVHTRFVLNQSFAYLRHTDGYWQVWLSDRTGSNHRQLSFDPVDKARLSWSSNRQQFLINRNDGRLFTLDLTGEQHSLTLPLNGMLDAQWNKAGSWISFSHSATQTTSNNDIWITQTDGRSALKLTNIPGVSQLPSWQAGQQVVVYSAATGRGYHIWRADFAGNTEQMTVGLGYHFDPQLTGDGKLLYTANPNGNYDIWLQPSKGRVKQLTVDTAYDAQPTLAENGHDLLFYSQRGGAKRVWYKNIKTEQLQALTPENVLSRSPIWLEK